MHVKVTKEMENPNYGLFESICEVGQDVLLGQKVMHT